MLQHFCCIDPDIFYIFYNLTLQWIIGDVYRQSDFRHEIFVSGFYLQLTLHIATFITNKIYRTGDATLI